MRRILHGAMGALALTLLVTTPAVAQGVMVTKCGARTTKLCAAALEDASLLESLAVGVSCAAMYASCYAVWAPVDAME